MKSFTLIIAFTFLFFSCDRIKRTAKTSINKTGETVGKGTSEFINGVSEGVDKTFQSQVSVTKELEEKGVHSGKFILKSTEGKQDTLSVYLIFDQDFDQPVTVKVSDNKGQEYGRSTLPIKAHKGEAKYFDFAFDKRTDFESRSQFVLE